MASFLFIPDISGYTRFVQETEVTHSRHVIAELLEVLIDADELGMTVAEIEGDAVLFFLPDRVPSAVEIAEQARTTFEAFHRHLLRFERDRICRCGACVGASGLTLKFVAHAGPIEVIRVRDFEKPYGPDVILAHRLLKNEVEGDEYLLFTDSCGPAPDEVLPAWASPDRGRSSYPELGEVCHTAVALGPLRAGIEPPEPRPAAHRMRDPVRLSAHLDLPIEAAFELVSSFDDRLRWNSGVDELEYDRNRVNRVGTPHRCVIGGNLVEFETTTADFGGETLVYGERLLSRVPVDDPTVYYILEPAEGGTRVRVEVHYRPRGLLGGASALVFRLVFRRSLRKALRALEEAAREEGSAGGTTTPAPSR